ncbi:phosphatase PAP2 family protein [Aeromicrobium chenweiae]|uniref:PA-phosphatase n=1 Tax=Aeromicrobium chenweiae TaxID=2079793 RepID=A0A2S0WM14_9ACTN|nr:phosphatase PAP2 family protein [Aeromicrobium chenweiae]AWB92351.1 PA-phosphatase [Aeromicrobium chenweiae]TGN31362.1 inositol phosphorylceramide synthase [Aeromicrobium chenweiae]
MIPGPQPGPPCARTELEIEVVTIAPQAASAPDTTVRPWSAGPRWWIWTWVLVIVFGAVALWRSHQVDVPLRDPDGRVFMSRIALSLGILVVLIVLDGAVRARRREGSVRRTWAAIRSRWTPDRVLLAVTGLLAYHLVYSFYRNLKSWNAFRAQHDDALLDTDRWLFFGHSPAVLLHDLFGRDVAPHVFRAIYESFSIMVPISFVAALVLAPRIREGYVFLTSAMWVWILGVGSYYLIPAIGPFDSAPDEFAGLDRTSVTATQAKYMAERAELLLHPGAADSFASIGAFASLHTGFTFLVLLMLRYYGLRRAANVMVVYLVAVMVSTIYLGWHFVLDDVAGLAIAWAAVRLGRLTVYPPGRSVA